METKHQQRLSPRAVSLIERLVEISDTVLKHGHAEDPTTTREVATFLRTVLAANALEQDNALERAREILRAVVLAHGRAVLAAQGRPRDQRAVSSFTLDADVASNALDWLDANPTEGCPICEAETRFATWPNEGTWRECRRCHWTSHPTQQTEAGLAGVAR